jgi:hypothetical protein
MCPPNIILFSHLEYLYASTIQKVLNPSLVIIIPNTILCIKKKFSYAKL